VCEGWDEVGMVNGLAGLADFHQAERGRGTLEVVCLVGELLDLILDKEVFHLFDRGLGLVAEGPDESLAELAGRVAVVEGQDLAEGVHVDDTVWHVYLARLERDRGVLLLEFHRLARRVQAGRRSQRDRDARVGAGRSVLDERWSCRIAARRDGAPSAAAVAVGAWRSCWCRTTAATVAGADAVLASGDIHGGWSIYR